MQDFNKAMKVTKSNYFIFYVFFLANFPIEKLQTVNMSHIDYMTTHLILAL